jgi:GNAT superfamily N-acetyltransferase
MVTARLMRTEDAAVVVDMARALASTVGDPMPVLTVDDLVRDGLGLDRWFDCFVAELKGALVGYALASKGYEAHTGKKRLWLGDLYVQPNARQNGVGRLLVAAVARHAVELGCDAVYWELWRPNTSGRAFYRRLGAKEAADLTVLCLDGQSLAAIAVLRW